MIEKIISGGQTGVDLAALDAAIAHHFDYGGWCPKGRINEKGVIDNKYSRLVEVNGDFENETSNYNKRTRCNIRDSDATLILVPEMPLPVSIKDGTFLTIEEVKKQGKPFLIIDLSRSISKNEEITLNWIKEKSFKILNIAGPRESSWPGIYQSSRDILDRIISKLKQ